MHRQHRHPHNRENCINIKFKVTSLIGYALSGLGLLLAIWSPALLASTFIYLSAVLAVIGLVLCLGTPFARKVMIETVDFKLARLIVRLKELCPNTAKKKRYKNVLSGLKSGSGLLIGQLSLLGITVLLFSFLETQTRVNTRLHALPAGQFLQILKSHIFTLGLLPWAIYSVLGVGLSYFSLVRQRIPYLPKVIFPEAKRQPGLFFHNLLSIIIEVNISFPILFVTILAVLYFCDGCSMMLGNDSLHHTPMLTMLVLGMFLLAFRLINNQFVQWMVEARFSLGNMLILFMLAFTACIVWLYCVGGDFLLRLHPAIPLLLSATKSHWVGSIPDPILQTRLQLLIWAWWMVWIPWMTTLVARYSAKLSIRMAILKAMICPVLVFWWVSEKLTIEDWALMSVWLETPKVRLSVAVVLLFFIWQRFGKMKTTMDVSLGCMLPLKRWRHRTLKGWMKIFSSLSTIYLIGTFTTGWVPTQVIATYGAGFLTVLVAFFLGILGLDILREIKNEKNSDIHLSDPVLDRR